MICGVDFWLMIRHDEWALAAAVAWPRIFSRYSTRTQPHLRRWGHYYWVNAPVKLAVERTSIRPQCLMMVRQAATARVMIPCNGYWRHSLNASVSLSLLNVWRLVLHHRSDFYSISGWKKEGKQRLYTRLWVAGAWNRAWKEQNVPGQDEIGQIMD